MTRRPGVGAGHLPWGEGMRLPGLAVRGYVICLQEVAPYPVTRHLSCPEPSGWAEPAWTCLCGSGRPRA